MKLCDCSLPGKCQPEAGVVSGIYDIRRRKTQLLFLLCVINFPLYAQNEQPPEEEPAGQVSGYVEAGVGYQSDDSVWFGRYTGLTDKGPYFIGNLDIRSRKEDGSHTDVTGRRLGLDSRSIMFTHGVQGDYELDLIYDQLPNFVSDTAVTPYVDEGDNTLKLTGSVLDQDSFNTVEIGTERRRAGGKLSFTPGSNWKVKLAYRHEEKEGTGQQGAVLGYSARRQSLSILPKPIEYTTDLVDASLGYAKDRGHVELGYHLSMFRNANDSLTWENPFPSLDGETGAYGRLALEPDNDFQQLMVSGGYRITDKTYLTGVVSSGLMTQDQQYLPYTINENISTPELPRESLDGKVRQNIVDLKLASRPGSKWNINGAYRYHDHDNQTSQTSYVYPIADSFNSGTNARDEIDLTETNQPYSYTQQRAGLDAKYRIGRWTSLTLGYDYENFKRDNSDVDETDEHDFWGKFKWKHGLDQLSETMGGTIDSWLRLGHITRDGTGYNPPVTDSDGLYIENPLLRKYNMADLERDELRLYLSYSPIDTLTLAANAGYANDDYEESLIGLTAARHSSATLEATLVPTEDVTTYVYYTRDLIKSDQAGREAEAGAAGSLVDQYGPDWFAELDDTMDNFGIGLQWADMLPKVDAGVDYVYSKGKGETELQLEGASPFTDIRTQLYSLKIYAQYNHSRNLAFRLRYWHEDYESSDWAVDGVDPVAAEYPTSLFMGEGSPDYDVDVLGLSMLYSF